MRIPHLLRYWLTGEKLILIILSLLFFHLQYHLWFGKGSYQEHRELQAMIKRQQEENLLLKHRNNILIAEVADLKQGTESIEERARLELGMIKQGEVFYQIVE
jgi:cell division protein FtsB